MLPANAPPLGATIETDLAEHGFALLRGAMALRAQAGASDLTSKAFERAANAFEALIRNGDPGDARSRLPAHDRRCGLPSGRLLGRRLFACSMKRRKTSMLRRAKRRSDT